MHTGDKIRYFFEEDALDQNGNLVVDKAVSINKIGHAIHELEPVFREFSTRQPLKDIALALGYNDPRVLQSMVIFKNPKIGGSHKKYPPLKRMVRDAASGTKFIDLVENPEPEEEYVCVPTKAGTLVLIHGQVLHKSGHNLSDKSRNIYTFHMIEGENSYASDNWLQPTAEMPFMALNSE
ncbi:Phytanoyl-CoA dioxygenase domain-containing protein 1 [Podochytrium sp. JEL0797]|nr:Phytanoyl-CoA dioxygenase domain-containing protein 1 [Podochytrium sp. JEL0797]